MNVLGYYIQLMYLYIWFYIFSFIAFRYEINSLLATPTLVSHKKPLI